MTGPEFRAVDEARRLCREARSDAGSGGLVDAGRVLDALDRAERGQAGGDVGETESRTEYRVVYGQDGETAVLRPDEDPAHAAAEWRIHFERVRVESRQVTTTTCRTEWTDTSITNQDQES